MVSDALTDGIRVRVRSAFVPARSDPAQKFWFFVYQVTIINEGDSAATLRSRHWIIQDGTGLVEHIKGPGVVGEQPRLEPGDEHVYTSGCPLSTSIGSMKGSFEMHRDDGQIFKAQVAGFTLVDPSTIN
ncbi:MAG: ApaG protein [Cognaticolwellia sp.]|jgi:ApaG protein